MPLNHFIEIINRKQRWGVNCLKTQLWYKNNRICDHYPGSIVRYAQPKNTNSNHYFFLCFKIHSVICIGFMLPSSIQVPR